MRLTLINEKGIRWYVLTSKGLIGHKGDVVAPFLSQAELSKRTPVDLLKLQHPQIGMLVPIFGRIIGYIIDP